MVNEQRELFEAMADCNEKPRCNGNACQPCEIARLRKLIDELSPSEGWATGLAPVMRHWFVKGRKHPICESRTTSTSERNPLHVPTTYDCGACAFQVGGGKTKPQGKPKKARTYPKGGHDHQVGWAINPMPPRGVGQAWHFYRHSTGSICSHAVNEGKKVTRPPTNSHCCGHCQRGLRGASK